MSQRFYNHDRTSKYIGIFDMQTPLIMIRDPEVIKLIGVKHFDNFPEHKQFVDEDQDPFFGKNLFAMRGQSWKELRNLLTPAFTASKMRVMFELINKCALDFSGFVIDDATKSGAEVDVKDAFSRYTNDVIASCAFGLSVDSMRDPNNEFYLYGKKATDLGGWTMLKMFFVKSFPRLAKFCDIRITPKDAVQYFKSVVKETIDTRDAKGIVRPDMIQLMMDARGKTSDLLKLSLDDMTAQAFIFFLAGFETVNMLMCFITVLLARYPEVHEKLQKECDEVMRQTEGKPTYEKIVAMTYMDAVVNETLRLYPLVPTIDRVCVSDFELPPNRPGEDPVKVKAGMGIWLSAYGIHRDPKFYPDPEKFVPERFLNVKVALNQPEYLPFGIGPRACIGNRFALLETKIVVFYLLAKCNFKPSQKMKWPIKYDKSLFTLMPEGRFWVNLEKRTS